LFSEYPFDWQCIFLSPLNTEPSFFFLLSFLCRLSALRGVGPSEVNANAEDVCGVEGQESAKRAQHPTPDNLKPLNYNANKNGNTLSDALSLALSIYRQFIE